VSKAFATQGGEEFQALQDVNLEIADKEIVCIIGSSGGGKTTLLNLIAGLLFPSKGQIFSGENLIDGPGRDRGVVFQQDSVFMWRTVQQNIEFGLEMNKMPKRQRSEIVARNLNMVRLDKFANFYPKELSGGMKKKVQLATVLANQPQVLLMDEPYGSLDYPTKCELQRELLRVLAEVPTTTIFVTHDIEEALYLADRIVCICDGRVTRIVKVPFSRPREESLRMSLEMTKLKQELWNELES
jgi:NitT/TauT family transport system ATP-binding protein